MRIVISTKGFSVVEMLVAVALFSMVVMMSLAAMITLIAANQKARSVKVAVDNLHFGIDEMVRDFRLGSKYYCTSSPSSVVTNGVQDCAYGAGGNTLVAFRDRNSKAVFYWYDASANGGTGCIKKKVTGAAWSGYSDHSTNGFSCITSPDITIDRVRFYVYNTSAPSSGVAAAQPFVVVSIKGTAGTKASTRTTFSIMTSADQRIPHNAE